MRGARAPPHAPGAVAAGAAGRRRAGAAGTQGPRVSAVARQRIPRGPDGLAERSVGLGRKRSLAGQPP